MRQNTKHAIFLPLGLAAVMTPAIMLAAGGTGTGFDAVVHGLASRYHGHTNHVPFMALISGVAGIATHGGVRGLHVAEIEHVDGPVDGAELNALVEQHVGKGLAEDHSRDQPRRGRSKPDLRETGRRPDGIAGGGSGSS